MSTQFIHKKSLGQNFLKDDTLIARIVDLANILPTDAVLEIGPGQGILTALLAKRAQKVVAIELDDRLIPILAKRFANNAHVTIIHDDVLKTDFSTLSAEHALPCTQYKIVANIPYYITAPLIRFFLEQPCPPASMTLMVQKEVAQRLCAKPGAMSILAIAAQYYADVTYGFLVPRDHFDPVPAVDSAVIHLNIRHATSDAITLDTKDFFRVVKMGFSAKRKTLCNNLANGLHREKGDIDTILKNVGLREGVRAQELSVDDWKILTQKLSLGK
ncbi:MAG: 16S rRNA (adenine(1518)-N(6)/adenine(1519)-N(6))-dimethyltransferase RsmA [Parcubacteria group bacterium]|jgi:16S rRNA (adenine1518-N6/adenine1519-N6)-dimethyltransferase